MVQEFCDNGQTKAHDKFQRWRADNPKGFFINCRASAGWMVHRVGCPHTGDTDLSASVFGSLTRKRKACSTDLRELQHWARKQGHDSLVQCSDCKP